jgi:hypothetical protein
MKVNNKSNLDSIAKQFSRKNISLYSKNPVMGEKYNSIILKPDEECT